MRRIVARGRGGRRRMKGGDFLGIGNWFKNAANTVWGGIKKAHNWVKDNKLISRGFSLIPHPGGKLTGAIINGLGYGRRKRRMVRRRVVHSRRRGGSVYSRGPKSRQRGGFLPLGSLFSLLAPSLVAGLAAKRALGKGRGGRRRVGRPRVVRRRRRGGSFLSDLRGLAKTHQGSAHQYVKNKRYVSSGLHSLSKRVGQSSRLGRVLVSLRNYSSKLGYGRGGSRGGSVLKF